MFKKQPIRAVKSMTSSVTLPKGIIGVTFGWDGKPHLCFEDGKILWGNTDRILYPQYFKNGDYPTDPKTNKKLPIVKF